MSERNTYPLLPKAQELMSSVDADIAPPDQSTALKAMGKDKAPGPPSFTVRHILEANISNIPSDLFHNVLKKSKAPFK
jgi:hypothetical protein